MSKIDELIEILHTKACSCVVRNGEKTLEFYGRGVVDLYDTLELAPDILRGALIADKVVGKGAAALMILGGVAEVYADVMSKPAASLLENAGVKFSYADPVEGIINRAGDGPCPVEALTADCTTAAECFPIISDFIQAMRGGRK